MKRMIAMTIRPGAVTAAVRLICPSLTASTNAASGSDEHEEEGAEQLREKAAPLEAWIVELGPGPELERVPGRRSINRLLMRIPGRRRLRHRSLPPHDPP